MRFIDSHAHLADPAFDSDPTRVAKPLHGGVTILVERRIAEVRVAVDEGKSGHGNENRRLRGGFVC